MAHSQPADNPHTIPRPQIDYRLGDFTERGMAQARRLHDLIFDAVGVTYRGHGDEFFGAGVFPTAGAANPTLTLAALALWAADTILRDLQN